jgi:hypothetical protein
MFPLDLLRAAATVWNDEAQRALGVFTWSTLTAGAENVDNIRTSRTVTLNIPCLKAGSLLILSPETVNAAGSEPSSSKS